MGNMIPRVAYGNQAPRYPTPWSVAGGLAWDTLTSRPRSFVKDARRAVAGLRPPLEVVGEEHVPPTGPLLLTCNHYSRPGFQAWWLAFAITTALAERRAAGADEDVVWVMTAAWRFETSRWKHRVLTPISRRTFARIARTYGFVTMPPMPPAPEEMHERAAAVLRTVRLARRLAQTGGVLGLAPEGRDVPVGLADPPPGAGDFIALLVEAGMTVLPCSVTEANGQLRVRFGPAFVPVIPANRAQRDRAVADQVMNAIARLLPEASR